MVRDPAQPLVDIGANLTNRSFRNDLDAVLERAFDAGVQEILVTGTDEESSLQAAQLAEQHPGRLYATAGVHPHDADAFTRETEQALSSLLDTAAVVAVGETGLDFNRNYSAPDAQIKAFETQLELACQTRLPVFLHERDAFQRQSEMLMEFRHRLSGAVSHCFTGSRKALYGYLDLDLYIGITGWICDERRGAHLKELVREIPANRLLLETDAPYLLPRTLEPRPRDRRNEPAFLTEVLRVVAACVNKLPEQLAAETTANARRLFRLPKQATQPE